MTDNNNASTMIVALVAILVIVAIGFIVLRVLPTDTVDDESGLQIDVNNDEGIGGITAGSADSTN